ncbi:hypothetical protein J2X86_000314 [Acinetobacter lwoffii]|uniref:Uncharacterized protein n=1 Tax=Acinetobacter lwoffii TaxID=28090 RepID=A0AAW8LD00_ACILW|nr:hypothetical protein [Acinetobacter lwoffii]MDR6628326.1 hypothetical protein [Acinetobacter lwoffii]
MKKEDEQNKGPIKLGTLTPELLKKLNEQMGNNEDGFKELQRLNLERARQLEELAKQSKGPQADEHWRPAPQAMQDPLYNTKIEHAHSVKPIKPVDFNFLKLTISQIKELPTEELHKFLSGESHSGAIHESTIQLISNEILSRQIKEASKPHWTVTPTFIVGCIAAVLAATSILVTIYFSVFYKAEDNNKHADQSYTVEKNTSPK